MGIRQLDIFAQNHYKPISDICTTFTYYVIQRLRARLTNLQIRKTQTITVTPNKSKLCRSMAKQFVRIDCIRITPDFGEKSGYLKMFIFNNKI